MDWILEFYNSGALGSWIAAITAVVTGSTAITLMTKTNVDDKVLGWIIKILNMLAGNFGLNKNMDDKK